MKNSKANNISTTEGLIRIEYFENAKPAPRADNDTHIVIMRRVGSDLQYYQILRNSTDIKSISESLQENYVFYYVDMRPRHLRIDQKFDIFKISKGIRVVAEITYQVKDAKKVVLATEDALLAFQSELLGLFRRETGILTLQDAKDLDATRKVIQNKISLEVDRILEQTGFYITHVYFDLYLQESEISFHNLNEAKTVSFDEDGISSTPTEYVQRLEGNSTTDAPLPKKKKKKRRNK